MREDRLFQGDPFEVFLDGFVVARLWKMRKKTIRKAGQTGNSGKQAMGIFGEPTELSPRISKGSYTLVSVPSD